MVSLWAKVLSPRGKRGGSLVTPSCIVDSIVLQYNSVPVVKAGVAHLLREGSWRLKQHQTEYCASDSIRLRAVTGTSGRYRRKRMKTLFVRQELIPQMAGFGDTGRQ